MQLLPVSSHFLPWYQMSVFSCDQLVNKMTTKRVESCCCVKRTRDLAVSAVRIPFIKYLSTQMSTAPSFQVSRLYVSNIGQSHEGVLFPTCCSVPAIAGSDQTAAEPTGLSFQPQFVCALWPLKNLTELADGQTLYVRRQRQGNWVVSSDISLRCCCTRDRLSVCLPSEYLAGQT
jgi:hypothetical protein